MVYDANFVGSLLTPSYSLKGAFETPINYIWNSYKLIIFDPSVMCIYKRRMSYKGAVEWNGLNPAMTNIDSYLNYH